MSGVGGSISLREPLAASVVGLGKLGAPIAACLAARGLHVVGVDASPGKREALAALRAPVFEPGLDDLLMRTDGRLAVTDSIAEAVAETELTFLVLPTPSEADGTFSLSYLLPACTAVGEALAETARYHVVVVTSTVMPGATDGELRRAIEEASGGAAGDDFGLCYSPEFIALGSVIHDFLNPDLVLVGESDARAGDALGAVYARVCENDPPIARMSLINAELAKLAVNSFVTTKISFANMLARICERLPGADVDTVTAALGLDGRIGSRYLRGAIGYGGPCFPRDNAALVALARENGAPADLAEATDGFNRAEVVRLRDRVLEHLDPGETVAVLGLAYKPGTDLIEESPGVELVRELVAAGIDVVAYDPAATESAAQALDGRGGRFADSLRACVAAADVIVVATPWPEFRELDREIGERPRLVIDCWRLLDSSRVDGCAYVALGVGAAASLDLSCD